MRQKTRNSFVLCCEKEPSFKEKTINAYWGDTPQKRPKARVGAPLDAPPPTLNFFFALVQKNSDRNPMRKPLGVGGGGSWKKT